MKTKTNTVNPEDMTLKTLEKIVDLKKKIAQMNEEIVALLNGNPVTANVKVKKRRVFSEETRQKMAASQKARREREVQATVPA